MKRLAVSFLLPALVALVALLFQGCYTQIALRDDEPSYDREPDTNGYAEQDYDRDSDYDEGWHSHRYIGFNYYYPSWSVTFGYGGYFYDPWYYSYDPWYGSIWYPRWGGWYPGWWGPPIVAYYPVNYYRPYDYYSYGTVRYRDNFYYGAATRNTGVRRTSGGIRTDYRQPDLLPARGSSGPMIQGGARRTESGVSAPATGTRRMDSPTTRRVAPSSPRPSAPSGRSSGTERRTDVQQPRHRETPQYQAPPASGNRGGSTRSTESGSRRSSEPTHRAPSSPSYSPPAHSSPAPSPAPSRSGDGGGGGRRESGSDRGSRR